MHNEVQSGHPSLVNDDLVRKINERVRDDRCFTISDLSLHFPQISRTLPTPKEVPGRQAI